MAEDDTRFDRPAWTVDPPAGSADRELIDQVHPPGWRNPEPAARYHLVVVGAGTAGLVSAAGAAGLGARVALVERSLMGGDCLNVGCVPSKGVIRAARAWHEAREAAARFAGPAVAGDGDFAAVMERMRRIRADISHHDSAERFQGLGVDVFLGQGRFVAPDALEVDGRRLRFRRAVIATGARAAVPPIDGLAEAGYRTNETIFDLRELPRRLAVVGGGPIGCEMAQSFARLGSAVTLIDRGDRLLSRDDADASAHVQRALEADGVRLLLGHQVRRVDREGEARILEVERAGGGPGDGGAVSLETVPLNAVRLEADVVLVAVGRAPNVEGLGLEAAGVAYDRRGVTTDDHLRTTNKRIYAAGDIASRWKFTHVADAEARIVIQNALFFGRKKASDLIVPWCTYTSPEVAHVGLDPQQVRQRGDAVETITVPLETTDRARLDGDEGFLKVHVEQGGDTILGATLVAPNAGETISEISVAMAAGAGLGSLAGVIHPYPTQAEVIKRAADQWRRGKLTPTVAKLFRGWFKLFR